MCSVCFPSDKGQLVFARLPETQVPGAPWEWTEQHEAVAVPGAPTRWQCTKLSGSCTRFNKELPPSFPTQRNPDGVFNFDTKHSILSLEIIYKETRQMNSVVAAAQGDEWNPTSWCGHEHSETRATPGHTSMGCLRTPAPSFVGGRQWPHILQPIAFMAFIA